VREYKPDLQLILCGAGKKCQLIHISESRKRIENHKREIEDL